MNILGKIFSSGATALVNSVGGIIDNLHTSEEEGIKARLEVQALIADYETKMEAEVSSRWNADMQSDSWFAKNVRPLVLIFLVISTVLMIFIDDGSINFVV